MVCEYIIISMSFVLSNKAHAIYEQQNIKLQSIQLQTIWSEASLICEVSNTGIAGVNLINILCVIHL